MTNETSSKKKPFRRHGLRALSQTVSKITQKSFEKQGFAEQEVIANWHLIVGETLADISVPVKISRPRGKAGDGSVMQVRVDQAGALDFQHLSPIIVDRINTYYGYRAIERISILQGPVVKADKPASKPNRPLTSDEAAQLEELLADIDNENLRRALMSFGSQVLTDDGDKT